MGCDGGTIPTRDELVRLKKKPEQKDKTADLVAKWKHCAISQEPLRPPVMACQLGRLYNKETVLEFLIDQSKFECAASFDHLKGLKDVKELQLTENKSYSRPKSEKGDGYIDTQDAKYICPVVGLEMNGTHRFCFVWGCGCVLSERALKEVKGTNCHKCGKTFSANDVIVLNGTEEDVEGLRARMEERRLQAKLDKKARKANKKKSETVVEEGGASSSKQMRMSKTSGPSKLANGTSETAGPSSKLTNGFGGARPKVANDKHSKITEESKLKSSNGDLGVKKGSIQNDPTASAAYKSLFTSSSKAKNQTKAHWVTYNPCFY